MNANRIAVVLALMLLTIAPNLHAACSNESLHGTYGYSARGSFQLRPTSAQLCSCLRHRLVLSPLTEKESSPQVLTLSTRRTPRAKWAGEPSREHT